ncbi:MAG: DUF4173 domain-containing protein [Bacteroidota bacterium]
MFGSPGLGYALWGVLVVGTVLVLSRRWERADVSPQIPDAIVLLAAALWITLAVRDSGWLTFASIVSGGLLLSVVAFERRPATVGFLGSMCSAPFRWMWNGVIRFDWKNVPYSYDSSKTRHVVLGLGLALPILFLFSVLLSSADVVFASWMSDVLSADLPKHVSRLLLAGILASLVGGILLDVSAGSVGGSKGARTLPALSAQTVLGLINVLLAAYVVLQITYLWHGVDAVLEIHNLTYAEFARRGFFELVTVAVLDLAVLSGLVRRVGKDHAGSLRVHGRLQVGLLLAILGTAGWKMWAYQHAYGWTELRLYVSIGMVWLSYVLFTFVSKAMRGHTRRWVRHSVVAASVVVLGLNVVNVPAWIVHSNAARSSDFDVYYHAHQLSADAAPALLNVLPELEPATQEHLQRAILNTHQTTRGAWTEWNWNRHRAQRLVQHLEPTSRASKACEAEDRGVHRRAERISDDRNTNRRTDLRAVDDCLSLRPDDHRGDDDQRYGVVRRPLPETAR